MPVSTQSSAPHSTYYQLIRYWLPALAAIVAALAIAWLALSSRTVIAEAPLPMQFKELIAVSTPSNFMPDLNVSFRELEQPQGDGSMKPVNYTYLRAQTEILRHQFEKVLTLLIPYSIWEKLSQNPLALKGITFVPPERFNSVKDLERGHGKLAAYMTTNQVGYIFMIASVEMIGYKLEEILRNEFFHAIISGENRSRNPVIQNIEFHLLPFLNADATQVDSQLRASYAEALTFTQGRVQRLKRLLTIPKEKCIESEQKELQAAKMALKKYKPFATLFVLSAAEYKNLIQSGKMIQDGNKTIILQDTLVGDFFVNKKHPVEVLRINQENDRVYIHYQNIGTKAEKFLADFEQIEMVMAEGIYSSFSSNRQLAELGSFIYGLPAQTRQHFAKEFCELMAEYVRMPEFCYTPTYPSTSTRPT